MSKAKIDKVSFSGAFEGKNLIERIMHFVFPLVLFGGMYFFDKYMNAIPHSPNANVPPPQHTDPLNLTKAETPLSRKKFTPPMEDAVNPISYSSNSNELSPQSERTDLSNLNLAKAAPSLPRKEKKSGFSVDAVAVNVDNKAVLVDTVLDKSTVIDSIVSKASKSLASGASFDRAYLISMLNIADQYTQYLASREGNIRELQGSNPRLSHALEQIHRQNEIQALIQQLSDGN